MTIKNVGVIGAGIMGSGIAQIFASKSFKVVLQDVKEEFCERGLTTIKKSLGKLLAKERISQEDHDNAISNIKVTTNIEDLKETDFAIEAATENVDLKLEIFSKLDNILPEDAILASNTSSILISKIASVTSRPGKVVGMHFMNPVPIMKGVEIIRGKETSKETEEVVVKLAETLGKTVVRSNDFPGFIANRILMPMINEAAYALHDGVAEREDIDTCMIACCNFPMGPLALADLIGLDTVVAILNVIYEGLKDEKYKPCPNLLEHVKNGNLGKKTGKGFYDYK